MSHLSSRISALDSLRGIAALIVVFSHFQLIISKDMYDSALYKFTAFHWLVDGRMAVMLFFVLSGFVLALPFRGDTQFSYKKFLTRRFCRIYLPFAVSIMMAAGLWFLLASGQHMSFELNGWGTELNMSDFFSHLLATGVTGSDYLNPPIWTLVQEMRVAIIFPLLVYIVRRGGMGAVVAAVITGFLAGKGYAKLEPGKYLYFADTLVGTILLTFYYVQFFMMGIYLALYRERWMALMDKVPARLFAVAGVAFFIIPPLVVHLPFSVHELYLAGIGIFLIATCVKFAKFQNVLSFGPFQWLGKVSYSLYLTHTIVMMAMIYALHNYFSKEIILALAFPLILVTAHLIQKYVENPSHELGKKLTSRMA